MMETSAYAFPSHGAVYVLGDGPELLVYSAINDAPLWKKFCDGRLVGLGATRDHVFAVDTLGRLTRWRSIDGGKLDELHTQQTGVLGLVVSLDGQFASWNPEGVCIGPDRLTISVRAPRAVAFSADGRTIAVGTEDGTVEWFNASNAELLGRLELPSTEGRLAVAGLCWKPGLAPGVGQWLVTAGSSLFFYETPVQPLLPTPGAPVAPAIPKGPEVAVQLGGTAGAVACMADGALAAVNVGDDVVLLEMMQNTAVGAVRLQRPVVGLAFGPRTWLGIGFENGDANRLDVFTGQVTKSEAHPGRMANRWFIKVAFDALKMRQVVARYRAGGNPIARAVTQSKDEKKGRGCLFWVGITFLVLFLCAGCSGTFWLLYDQFYLTH